MDLSTMMSKIDRHSYQTCKEFLDDIGLICENALEYNPDSSSNGALSSLTLLFSHSPIISFQHLVYGSAQVLPFP